MQRFVIGTTVMPGIVGLHDHMYYGSPVGGSMRPMLDGNRRQK
jgi:predicted amidohydrolase